MKAALKIILALGASVLSLAAQAQFVGDLFFVQPSVTIAQGGTGQLQLALFTGNRPFGAAFTELAFDASAMEVVDVTAPTNGVVAPELKWEKTASGVKILTVNGRSRSEPFGTVVLATVTVRPLIVGGGTIQVASTMRQTLDAEKASYPVGQTYGAEINVGLAVATIAREQGRSVASTTSDPTLVARAQRLRPPGHQVDMFVPSGNQTFAKTQVRTLPISTGGELDTSQQAK